MNRYRANPKLLAPILAALAMLGPFSIDAFFPAFKAMEAALGVDPAAMQLTLSAYLGAYALMSLVHGPLSDAYGRRGVIVYSLLVFAIASAGCALSTSFAMLMLFRVLQGISAGAGMIVGRAIIRDRFDGADAQRLMSQVTLIFGVAPALAPIIGGWVLTMAGWRAIFWALGGFTAAVMLLSIAALPETHPRQRRVRFAAAPLARTYGKIVGDGRFVLLGLAASCNFGALFTYIASAPAIVLNLLRLNERQFAWLFVPTIGGMMIGSLLSGRLAGKLSTRSTVTLGYSLMGCGVLANLAISSAFPPGVPWTVLPIGLMGMGVSLAFPTLTLLMLDRFPAVRGAAASVQAAFTLSFSAVVSGVISPRVSQGTLPLALTAGALIAGGFVMWRLYCRLTPLAEPTVLQAVTQPVSVATAASTEN
ncbi:MAG: multidrug effflux MFS transporter [Nevskia sp.]